MELRACVTGHRGDGNGLFRCYGIAYRSQANERSSRKSIPMTDITPVGSPRFPVDRAARSLMACARQDPSLVSRSRHRQADDERDPLRDLPAMFHRRSSTGRPDEVFSEELYLEELVSLASEAAERAGDASRQAAHATVALRHSRGAFALLGALGMAIGLAAAAGAVWSGQERQSRIAGELTAVQTLQRQADQQLAAVVAAQNHPVPSVQAAAVTPLPTPPVITGAAGTAAPLPKPPVATGVVGPLPTLHAVTIATRQEWSAEPVAVPTSGARAPVWTHRRRAPVRRVYQSYPAGPPVILVRVVQNIQRDVGALFR
jgi:hypothetical protein